MLKTLKTKDWIKATAVSRRPRRIKETIRQEIIGQEQEGPCLLSRASKRCPAIILAAKRTDRVIGRIRLLTTSIKTIKGIKRGGVPRGTK